MWLPPGGQGLSQGRRRSHRLGVGLESRGASRTARELKLREPQNCEVALPVAPGNRDLLLLNPQAPSFPRSGRGPRAGGHGRQPGRFGSRSRPSGRRARETTGGHSRAPPHHLQPGLARGVGRGRGRRGPGGGRRRQPGAAARGSEGVRQLGAATDVQRQLGAAARGRRRGQAGWQLGAAAGEWRRRRQLGATPPRPQPAGSPEPQPRRLLQPCHPGCGKQGERQAVLAPLL